MHVVIALETPLHVQMHECACVVFELCCAYSMSMYVRVYSCNYLPLWFVCVCTCVCVCVCCVCLCACVCVCVCCVCLCACVCVCVLLLFLPLQTATGLSTQEYDQRMGVLVEQRPRWREVYRNFTQQRERCEGREGEGMGCMVRGASC